MELDPTETFRQEASELLDSLETVLLDLGQTPQNRDLIDAAFRALHTIKGSGAMFGFDKVAAFTHDFETAFDLIRKGKIDANHEIVTVSLSARDYIRTLIEDPDSTDPIIGEAIVEELQRLIGAGPAEKPTAPIVEAPADEAPSMEPTAAGWRIEIAFEPGILRNGTNPLVLLDDLRALGPCTVEADTGAIPVLEELDPETCLITWTVTLESACSQDEIEDVFMFVRDEMKLVITPLDADGPAGFGLDMSMPGDAAPAVAEPAMQPKAAPAPAPA
ncbi:Hpt domain-containing protein, partial [Bosea sp. (in: a-proteobacteria)]